MNTSYPVNRKLPCSSEWFSVLKVYGIILAGITENHISGL